LNRAARALRALLARAMPPFFDPAAAAILFDGLASSCPAVEYAAW
jgi:hypothetical protein